MAPAGPQPFFDGLGETAPGRSRHINPEGSSIRERIRVPEGFQRVNPGEGSFGRFLTDLPLKPHGAEVRLYDGRVKAGEVHEAVIDMDIGRRDLQQCADAVIRLRAEYLYGQGRFEEIRFSFVNGFTADYSRWRQGYRVAVKGDRAGWVKSAGYSSGYEDFRSYLEVVFAYAGTLSLAKELKPVEVSALEIGDVFIQGGSPGHCAVVVDLAENPTTGERVFLLAQSYMPAQDIHVLKNPQDRELSPWYTLDFGEKLVTPQWTFDRGDLRRFD
ncbi:MAG: DUF4846 domain-containing protein [Syntrophomonadaceae bacterium]|nr:DUF4846 domain-containing protein [Syntrophomonadaceae bacterium]